MKANLLEERIPGFVNSVKAEVYILLKIIKQLFKSRVCLAELLENLLYGMPLPPPLQREPNETLITFNRGMKAIDKAINGVDILIHHKCTIVSSIKLLQPSKFNPLILLRAGNAGNRGKPNRGVDGYDRGRGNGSRGSGNKANGAAGCGVAEEVDPVVAFAAVTLDFDP